MILVLILPVVPPPRPCVYTREKNCVVACPPGTHIHAPWLRYKMGPMHTPVVGDGECFADVGDKWIGKPHYPTPTGKQPAVQKSPGKQ
jgi:hypothetical protein